MKFWRREDCKLIAVIAWSFLWRSGYLNTLLGCYHNTGSIHAHIRLPTSNIHYYIPSFTLYSFIISTCRKWNSKKQQGKPNDEARYSSGIEAVTLSKDHRSVTHQQPVSCNSTVTMSSKQKPLVMLKHLHAFLKNSEQIHPMHIGMLQSVPVMMPMCTRHLAFLWLVRRNMVVSTNVSDQAACEQQLKRTCVGHVYGVRMTMSM